MVSIRSLFEQHNLRCTSQRLAVYAALRESKDHPTAEELFRRVRPGTGKLSLATVYNTLEVLCRVGLCNRMATTNGSCRYDADVSEHMHVRLTDTGEIADVPDDLGEHLLNGVSNDVLREIERRLGVRIDGVSVQIHARRAAESTELDGRF